MKKIVAFIFLVFFANIVAGQILNSVLSQGEWYKFSIDTTGVFKIDKRLLQQIGISTSNLNPQKIHIYGNGGNLLPVLNSDFRIEDLQENAIYIAGESDGVFNDNDYILFYGQGPHSWTADPDNQTATHHQNIFSDEAYYFITISDTNGKRVQQKPPVTSVVTQQITTFDEFVFYEKELTNIFAVGDQWFGEDLSFENTLKVVLPFSKALPNTPLSLKVGGATVSSSASSIGVQLNTQDPFTINFAAVNSSSLTKGYANHRSQAFVNSATSLEVTVTFNNNGNPSARGFLDYIEVVGKKQLIADGNQFSFRSFEQANATGNVEFRISNAANSFQLWDVSNPSEPQFILNESTGDTFTFKAENGSLSEYIVLGQTDFYTPKTIENSKVENQNLHAIADINYLIITNNELINQAQRLADYHQNNSNFTTKVVLLNQIYNEFSSGSKDITGIRDFIKHLYNNNSAPEKKLKYVTFFGDASYDYKDRIAGNNNIVPVKLSTNSFNLAESYVTDDFFVMLEPHEGGMVRTHTVDVASGRIPVSTISEAKIAVDKILSYYDKEALGDWRNTITLLADDIDQTADIQIQSGVESIADDIKNNKPIFNVNKIYVDSYVQENSSGGERYPQIKTTITNAIEKGTLVFNYFGHGGEDGFASERILEKPQIQDFNNPNTLPLLITVTCDFSRFDNPKRLTAGELTFLNPTGGAAAMVTTTREVYISVGQNFNQKLMRFILEYNQEDLTISEALAKTKNEFSDTQKFFIYFFGDPAMKLAVPKPNVRITKMNGIDLSQSIDTLKALSRVNFEGIITDNSNTTLTDFNGSLSTTVFDKAIDKNTLDNDNFGIVLTFDTQDSKLFRGNSTVQNGTFNFEFIVPKDIKISYGKGKMSFYAENGLEDKAGYNFDVVVGGINENAPEDTIGPEIQLFMNDESFIDGGNTNASPNLIVLLSDISGINTSITAVDHDIVGVLDGDDSNPIILNDFYQTALDDFTNGKVNYKFRNLEVGPHTLKIKAWDTYNNSSEATLYFVVLSDTTLNLENVLNYPNPFVNYTEFWFQHNKPNELLEVQIQVFTISGKLIKTIHQNVQTSGSLSRTISWNGLDDFGNRIGKGVYIYKLRVKSILSNLVSEKYEKLVILQ